MTAVAATLLLVPCAARSDDEPLTRARALALARARAPELLLARARLPEARARLRGVTGLLPDDPVLEAAAGVRTGQGDETLEWELSLHQGVPLGGGRGLRRDEARAGIAVAEALVADATRLLLGDVARAFVHVLACDARSALAATEVEVTSGLLTVAERRSEAGDLGALELGLARSAAARARARVSAMRAEGEAARGALRVLLGLAADAALAVRGDLAALPVSDPATLRAALATRPDLRALQAELRQARAEAAVGGAEGWPELGIGVSVRQEGRESVAMGGLSMSLPASGRGQDVQLPAEARAHSLTEALALARRRAHAELEAALRAHAAQREAAAQMQQDVLPALAANEAAALRAHEAGELDVAELLLVRREALEARGEAVDRLEQAALGAIDVEVAAGVLR